jgi:Holliday junction resolvase-like predicted endonuclease
MAETAVAELLEQVGFEVIDRNWKTRICEIDLVAKKDGVVYFIEVKYRVSEAQGDGFEYITQQKLHKMNFSAEIWRQHYNWSGDYRLMAAAVSGLERENIQLIEV